MAQEPGGKPVRRKSGVQIGEAQARGMVLQGGARVFHEKGLRNASVDDILAAAGVARRTFYRLYASKEDVALALYQMGTDSLIQACRAAVAREPDVLKQIERFVDAHLANARMLGRLIFVLGGEAARQDSPLHAKRMQVHGTLAELLSAADNTVDPLLTRSIILSLEGVVRMMLEEGDEGRNVTPDALARVRRVMLRAATGAVSEDRAGVSPMPRRPPDTA